MIKTIPKKRNAKRQNGTLEEDLQIVEKRREVKGKGEKERYSHLNSEFQRMVRRNKKNMILCKICYEGKPFKHKSKK